MSQLYNHIATVTLKHSYFKNGVHKAIRFSIEEATAKRLKDLGIVFKTIRGGFHLFSSNPSLLSTSAIEDVLHISFFSEDASHINYTDLGDFIPASEILYFDNINTGNDPSSVEITLQKKANVGKSDIASINNTTLKIPSFDPQKDYIFKDANGLEISQELIFEIAQNTGVFSTSNLPEGIINVFADGTLVYKTYHFKQVVLRKPLGIISLFTHRLFEDYTALNIANYSISFTTIKTYWKYFFLNPRFNELASLNIYDKNKEAIFKRLPNQPFNNIESIVFQSKEPLPTVEYTKDHFQLIDSYVSDTESGPTVIGSLPVPSSEQLHIETSQNEQIFYSHIYIY